MDWYLPSPLDLSLHLSGQHRNWLPLHDPMVIGTFHASSHLDA